MERAGAAADRALAATGEWLRRHQGAIGGVQWGVVLIYAVLVVAPVLLPLPDRTARIWGDLTLFAQFVFWGLWWPGVILATMLVGRVWCGLLCPEGKLTEAASRWSLGRALPRWLTWPGWPLAAFLGVTIYGQMVSVYQYAKPALVVLGGSTLAAVAVGLVWGRNKRVWCRYLCPVNGVFELLAKLAPVSFQVDRAAWATAPRSRAALNCAPLVPVRTMRGAAACHMCGRCSGYRGAVRLARRSPHHEIVHVAGQEPNPWQTALILFGLLGIAAAAFRWTGSAWYVALRQFEAEWLVDHGILWPLQATAPWWILTNAPAENDVLTLLDGATLLIYLAAVAAGWALLLGGLVAAAAGLAGPTWSGRRFHHLAQTLIPVAGCGVLLGLSAITVAMLRAQGLDLAWVPAGRAVLLAGALAWSGLLAWEVAGLSGRGARRVAATALVILAGLAAGAGALA